MLMGDRGNLHPSVLPFSAAVHTKYKIVHTLKLFGIQILVTAYSLFFNWIGIEVLFFEHPVLVSLPSNGSDFTLSEGTVTPHFQISSFYSIYKSLLDGKIRLTTNINNLCIFHAIQCWKCVEFA